MGNEANRPLKLFLCHASGDKPAVRELYKRLIAEGVDAWLDQEKLLPGQDWRAAIPRAVRESDVVVICLSNKSITKEGYVQKEIEFALDIAGEKPEGTIFLIPARLEECDVPSRLSRWQWVDLFSDYGYENLMRSLRLRAEKLDVPLENPLYVDKQLDDASIPPCPYRGLFAFRPEDASFFFGREVATKKLVQATESRSLVAVLGASGSGKSSVVFAGLVPTLSKTGQWLFTTFRPGDDPFFGLSEALVPLYETELSKTKQMMETRELSNSLREDKLPLSDVLQKIHQTQPNHRLLIIADQFEELYTLSRESNARQHFLDILLSVLHGAISSTTHLVLTLRADFLGQASLYGPFAEILQGKTELLGPMNLCELARAIKKPAQRQGVSFEAKLITRILRDVGKEEGSLPLLEFALTELWQRQSKRMLTHAAYDAIGEVEGALSRHADKVFEQLEPLEKKKAKRIFVQLVNPGVGSEDTRRLATRSELEADWPLVSKLAGQRLVVTNQIQNEESVEIVHEALIQKWSRMREWMQEERPFRSWQDRMRFSLAQWQKSESDGDFLRGTLLSESVAWSRKRAEDLTQAEKQFITQSLDADETLKNKVITHRRYESALQELMSKPEILDKFNKCVSENLGEALSDLGLETEDIAGFQAYVKGISVNPENPELPLWSQGGKA